MHWTTDDYDRESLPEKVLMFGTGMLLRSLVATAVDDANRAGRFLGSIVAVQSTRNGSADALTRQDGLFTLIERGLENSEPVERTRVIGSIRRALVADTEWAAVRETVARPTVRVIVSNVTEAGFRIDDGQHAGTNAGAPNGFPAKLVDVLWSRFQQAPHGPPLVVIPTELVSDNGQRLAKMVADVVMRQNLGDAFREWIGGNVQFCSSLVDRITTAAPAGAGGAALTARLGYADSLVTVAEPHALWAIEGDRGALHSVFDIDDSERVIFASDISSFRDRKVRLLNGAHTAVAPLALLAGVTTVREATEHAVLGKVFHHILFGELVDGSGVAREAAESFAERVWDRFRNPWLDHAWTVVATNQSEKMRIRVIPSIVGFHEHTGQVPSGLSLALAAHLRFVKLTPAALDDDAEWGAPLGSVPGLATATAQWYEALGERGAVDTMAAWLHATHR